MACVGRFSVFMMLKWLCNILKIYCSFYFSEYHIIHVFMNKVMQVLNDPIDIIYSRRLSSSFGVYSLETSEDAYAMLRTPKQSPGNQGIVKTF